MSHNITVESGSSVRLPTAGKYCDRDIVITAKGGKEDLDAVLAEQEALIEELQTVLRSKASGGGGSNNYAKVTASTSSTTSFTIENPLGGIAKMVSIKAISPTITSSRKIHACCLDWSVKLGAVKAYYSSGNVIYTMEGTEGTPNNGQFRLTDGIITVYRFNSATTWDTTCEYEVEIWQ